MKLDIIEINLLEVRESVCYCRNRNKEGICNSGFWKWHRQVQIADIVDMCGDRPEPGLEKC